MPIFEYECPECGHTFEEIETIADRDKPHICPVCGGKRARRIVSLFSAGGSSGPASGGCSTNGFT